MNEQEALVADLPSGIPPALHPSLEAWSQTDKPAIRYQLTPPSLNPFLKTQTNTLEKLTPAS